VQPDWVLIHDAARPLLRPALLDRLLTTLRDHPDLDGVCPATVITDALKRVDGADQPIEAVARDGLRAVQTPQVFRYAKLLPLYEDNQRPSVEDDMAVAAAGGLTLRLVAGDGDNIKITYAGDVKRVEQLLTDGQNRIYRVGQGVDVHGWADVGGRPLRLGGLTIPSARGLAGHSDADVLLHALMDAILGALALGDIGQHFPSDDQRWAGADSADLLAHVLDLMNRRGGRLVNIDLTVVGESPKISPHRQALQANIAALTHLPADAVSVKATTTDHLGFLGRGEGLACLALVGLTLPHD
jgi:2-C-methyl-D-erythritol 4-phosphate cytidylyltransferase/2-C-methyl-D-erythritol 2,4-cyclodiphosphate synthase